MVSLLVSFTLTAIERALPARGRRRGRRRGHGHGGEGSAKSRGGFYAWLDRGYA